jgi:hypothetical protein
MKTTRFLAIVAIAMSVLASNAFALLRPLYPAKPTAPDTIIVITNDRHDWVRSTLRAPK